MGLEQVDAPEEDGPGSAAAADAAGCMVRKFVIGPASYVSERGGNVVRGGIAIPGAALEAGRKLVEAADTAEAP